MSMPTTATVTRPVRRGAGRARDVGHVSFDRLTQSVDAAQAALKDLRKELSKGTRDVLDDLDMTLRDARKNLRSVSRTVSKDLEEIQHALTEGKPPRARTGGSRSTAASAGTARKRTTARATTSRNRSTTAKATTTRAAKPAPARSEQQQVR